MITVLADLGLRVGELVGLDHADLGFERGHRTLRFIGKGGRQRRRALTPAASAALDDYLRLRGTADGPLFVTATGARIDRHAVFRLIRRLAAQAGIAAAEKLSPPLAAPRVRHHRPRRRRPPGRRAGRHGPRRPAHHPPLRPRPVQPRPRPRVHDRRRPGPAPHFMKRHPYAHGRSGAATKAEILNIIESVVLGVVEGITEFLPVSSTGHLTIFEKLFGEDIAADDITAFTAIIQSRRRLRHPDLPAQGPGPDHSPAGFKGLLSAEARTSPDWRFAWAVILGSIPIGIVGLVFQDQIEHGLRSLWVVAAALILWSGAMAFADHAATAIKHEDDVTWKDTLIIGVVQCLSLIPGVSRSGSTMVAGLLRDFDRVTVTKLSFFLSIPALFGATILQIHDYAR